MQPLFNYFERGGRGMFCCERRCLDGISESARFGKRRGKGI
jgi:hypothetical protein